MDSVGEILDTNFCGIKKLHPSYQSFPQLPEPYSAYSPGCGENGAIFCHANTWAIIAKALLGRPDRAWIGPENPKYGWANVTQVTGTAAWMDIAATQYLLGIRPELDGLRVAPCLPSDWPGFSVTRKFRGCVIAIEVQRGSVASLTIDGSQPADNIIPAGLLENRTTAKVICTVI